MIEHRLRTRSGWLMASRWAIIPPMETPTTWAGRRRGHRGGRPRRRPCRPACRSPRGVATAAAEDVRRAAAGLGRQPDVAVVEADDVEPWAASAWQNSSCQWMQLPPRPITRRTAGEAGSPVVSYSMLTPLALTLGMVAPGSVVRAGRRIAGSGTTPQQAPGVDAGLVAVAPEELKAPVAHQLRASARSSPAGPRGDQAGRPGPGSSGTRRRAVAAQLLQTELAHVPVGPGQGDGPGAVHVDGLGRGGLPSSVDRTGRRSYSGAVSSNWMPSGSLKGSRAMPKARDP